jgi:chorismate lyase
LLNLDLNAQNYAVLADKGSLTDRFKQMMGYAPVLTKLSQKRQFVSFEESLSLDIPFRQMALVREIKMADGENDWMFARTIVPHQTLSGPAKRIAFLNEKPIGQILFGRHGAKRISMQVDITSDFPQSLLRLGYEKRQPLWRRRSIFEFNQAPLLVTEIFLPHCPIYNNN